MEEKFCCNFRIKKVEYLWLGGKLIEVVFVNFDLFIEKYLVVSVNFRFFFISERNIGKVELILEDLFVFVYI